MRVCGCGSGCVWVCVGVCVWVCVCVFAFAVIFVTLLRRVAFRFKGIVVQLSVSSKLPAPRSYPDAWPHCQRVTDVGSADGRHALSYQRHSRSSCPQSHLRSTGYAKRVQLVRLFSPSRALSLSPALSAHGVTLANDLFMRYSVNIIPKGNLKQCFKFPHNVQIIYVFDIVYNS